MKNLFLRQNQWDNFALYEGTKKIIDSGRKQNLIDWARENYPNRDIIDKTEGEIKIIKHE